MNGPNKDYRNLYGAAKCSDCTKLSYDKQFRRLRCNASTNMTRNWLGIIWKDHPDTRNHLGKCEDFERKTD